MHLQCDDTTLGHFTRSRAINFCEKNWWALWRHNLLWWKVTNKHRRYCGTPRGSSRFRTSWGHWSRRRALLNIHIVRKASVWTSNKLSINLSSKKILEQGRMFYWMDWFQLCGKYAPGGKLGLVTKNENLARCASDLPLSSEIWGKIWIRIGLIHCMDAKEGVVLWESCYCL